MINENLLAYFEEIMKKQTDTSAAVAALQTMLHYIENDESETVSELQNKVQEVKKTLRSADCSVTCVQSACDIFWQFVTRTRGLDAAPIAECKQILLTRGNQFIERTRSARLKISKISHKFILDGSSVLTHARSRVVYKTLLEAAKAKKRFHVYVTESCPDKNGQELYNLLVEAGIPCTLILDAAVGYILEKVDFVLLGAEGVVESGGIINKIGTFPIAICASQMNKPVYVLAESFKFLRFYPLSQKDVQNEFNGQTKDNECIESSKQHPLVDYTPPAYLTLLFTDLGILTPSAVSDELIKLYG